MKLLAGLSLALCACISTAPPAPPSDGDCAAACANRERMHCVDPSEDDGVPCAEKCEAIENAGIPMHTECVSKATDCDEVRACAR